MRTTLPGAAAVLLACMIGCSHDTPPTKKTPNSNAATPDATPAVAAANMVTVYVEGMVWANGWGGRAKAALASLPWVDSKNVEIDIATQQVRFGVADMSQFDEQQLKDALKKKEFDKKIEVLSKAKT